MNNEFPFDPKKQTCKVCKRPDGFNFHVPNKIWNEVVPLKYVNLVVCLYCFDRFAQRLNFDYTPYLSNILFVGEQANFELQIK